jgi:hypothetical protein
LREEEKMFKNLLLTILVLHTNIENKLEIHCDKEYVTHLDLSYDDASLAARNYKKGLCFVVFKKYAKNINVV